jgi:lipooligosaccharide transport system permease protein
MTDVKVVRPPVLRVTPPIWRAARRPHRLMERAVMVYRRTPMILLSGFFEPLFYLLSIRVGFGSLVGDVDYAGRTYDYATFVAPALMAASAMNGAVYDSTMNVFFKLRHARTYDAVLATPLTAADVAVGEIGFAVVRGVLYSAGFLVTLVALGMAESAWVVLALPFCVLLGFAFASVGMAATTYMRSWNDFDLVPSVTMPLFLFSATFYPLASYGDWGWVVQLSPLYHGVALVRAANLGHFTPAVAAHIAVLVAFAAAGMTVASRRIERLLLS